MKNVFLVILLLSTVGTYATQADSLFANANRLYQTEKYSEALDLYKEIEKHNITTDDLLYNIANTYYKMNKVAPAIYYYEKVLQQSPNHTDAKFNLAFAQRMTIDNIEPLPKTLFQKIKQNVVMKLTYNYWAWLAVGLSFLFALLFLLYHFSYSPSSKRLFFVTSIISAFLALSIIFIAYQNYEHVQSTQEAIVFAQQTQVKTAPTVSSEISFELHEGTKVNVLESLDNWKKIRIEDGKMGWIVADDIKEL